MKFEEFLEHMQNEIDLLKTAHRSEFGPYVFIPEEIIYFNSEIQVPDELFWYGIIYKYPKLLKYVNDPPLDLIKTADYSLRFKI